MHGLPAPGTIVAGKYRVETLLGEGGMSSVFRAHHELMDKPVALKWLRPELSARPDAKDRFLREARASARIKHPNVVDVHDVGVHEGALFLVMELLEGESFAQLIQRGNISIPHALRLLLGAMEGVAFAHDNGIVHRDIKPENIFVVRNRVYPDGIAKILDFGISKLANDASGGGQNLTKTGHTVGTPEYMSMEQMTGEADVDGRADVYSFGVLLYRALTGITPFSGETFAAIAVKVATSTPLPPRQLRSELPPALEQVVMRAMARDRNQRFPNMRALIDALSFLGSTQGFLSQMQNPGMGAPLLTPTPQGLRDLVPFSNFRDGTQELGPPTKALTEQTPIPARIQAPAQARSPLPMFLGGFLVAAMGVGTYLMWPQSQVAGSARGQTSVPELPRADSPPTGGGTVGNQGRPIAPQPLDNGTGGAREAVGSPPATSAPGEWDTPQMQVQVEQAGTGDQGTSVLDALQKAAQEAAHEGTGSARDTSHRSSGVGRRLVRRDTVTRISVGTTQRPTAAEPAPRSEPSPAPAAETTKSATGRRSGTLRSDDF
jgi:serine/threonine protein kinase